MMEQLGDLWAIVSPLLFAAVLIGVLGIFVRQSFLSQDRKFARLYAGLDIAARPLSGRVCVRMHTYDGFLAWFVRTEHLGYASPGQAREFVSRVARYNLCWGSLCLGGPFVLLMTAIQSRQEKRSIARQEDEIHWDGPRRSDEAAELVDFEESY